MREDEIRPKELTILIDNMEKEERKALLEFKDKFMTVDCPACNSSKHTLSFNKDDYNFVSCNNCGTIYVNPRPSTEMLFDYYSNSKSLKLWYSELIPLTEEARKEKIFKPRAKKVVELCKKYSIATELLYDVGAGYGNFCEEIKKFNYFKKVIAIEPAKELQPIFEKKNVEYINEYIENVSISEANVITNFELIEHLFSPKDFILGCKNALIKGGLLILTTPNIKGFDLLVLKELSNNIIAPAHLNYFSTESLSTLISNLGFEILEVLTPGELDADIVREKILSGELNISDNPFFNYLFNEKWDDLGKKFQEFLSSNKLSSHQWIVARKL